MNDWENWGLLQHNFGCFGSVTGTVGKSNGLIRRKKQEGNELPLSFSVSASGAVLQAPGAEQKWSPAFTAVSMCWARCLWISLLCPPAWDCLRDQGLNRRQIAKEWRGGVRNRVSDVDFFFRSVIVSVFLGDLSLLKKNLFVWEEQKSLQLPGYKIKYPCHSSHNFIYHYLFPHDILLARKPKGIGKMLRVFAGAVVFLRLVAFQLSILAFCPRVRFFGNGCRMDFWLTVLSDGLSELWAFWNGRHERVRRKKKIFCT